MTIETQSVMVPLEAYLQTNYQPDCDWVCGALRDRNVSDRTHFAMREVLCRMLLRLEDAFEIEVLPEQRTRVSSTNYRVVDILVRSRNDPFERIVTVPPCLCIEILSPNDIMWEIHDRIDDYIKMGVLAVWVVDPLHQSAWLADRQGFRRTQILDLPWTDVGISVARVFSELTLFE